ncbi:MAG: hypothetical protein ACJASB_000724 [Shewanella psychromarinicola]|jgi:hypothetical protein
MWTIENAQYFGVYYVFPMGVTTSKMAIQGTIFTFRRHKQQREVRSI